ncbi:MAG TPA: S-methyl-5-thioribose-1-phosphate isomerase, partial [Armatimonadota bacterium]|nr:S-methyl-5-thioribose-1-phosphate isomerase [Armatimonadota bacterium]
MIRTVDYLDGKVVLIDQNRLPHQLVTIELFDYREVADAIKTMKVRGAPALGVTAAIGVALGAQEIEASDHQEFMSRLEQVASEIRATRPTAVNLFWGVDRILAAARQAERKPIEQIKEELNELARSMVQEDEDTCRRLGRNGAELLKDGDT